jgi:integration host factor subunit beta
MNRTALAEALSDKTGLPVAKADQLAKVVFDMMADALAGGDRVEIRGLGSFSVRHYGAYESRNPKTGEVISVKPKKLPYFKCGKELKERVDIYK